ncbi:putative receptor-like protein kinase At3g47110 [Musa acuminata AAA Group]|uniref:putative receptor-like protein kinase At3g47110 n=1 Tax=Musa acuminata AAA Group TaxID=214697 RepID=UPI0031E2869A
MSFFFDPFIIFGSPSWLLTLTSALIVPFLLSEPAASATGVTSDTSDLSALLSIRAHLNPFTSLSSWDSHNSSIPFCQWPGVTCGSSNNPGRVTALNLANLGLTGSVSSDIGNLTFLRSLNLSFNNLQGQLPPELGRLSHLELLVLSQNALEGRIPVTLANCSNLWRISLGSNRLAGEVPAEFGALPKLQILSLHDNDLSGRIPASLGNLSSVTHIDLVGNRLAGTIPPSLGRLQSLVHISVTRNSLTGAIPVSIFNLSSLSYLYVGYNQLSGTLPPDMGNTLVSLEVLQAFGNILEGPLPISLPNASMLRQIVLPYNRLSGPLPPDIGKLRYLSSLNLRANELETRKAEDWEFFTSLANCSNLKTLDLEYNKLEGPLPSTIVNLSTQLTWLGLGGNEVHGSIPEGIGRFIHLERLHLDQMALTGHVPAAVGKLRNLHVLSLDDNQLSGVLPSAVGNLTQLENLYLNGNGLQGEIPKSFGNLRQLTVCDLSFNKLEGRIPEELTELTSLTRYLNLSRNFFTGPLPAGVGSLKNLEALDISKNRLSGEIPSTIGECQVLQYLYLQGNHLEGAIPDSLGSLTGVQVLDLSCNNLSGHIPLSFERLEHVRFLNLSFNDLQGQVPNEGVFRNANVYSVTGNNKLCGGIQALHLQPCPDHAPGKKGGSPAVRSLVSIVITVTIFVLSLAAASYLLHRQRTRKCMPVVPSKRQYPIASYSEIYRATDGFSPSNIIGRGSFGQVYRGTMSYDSIDVAVKVFDTLQVGAFQSFKAECETLGAIRHRNVNKILTVCSSADHNGDAFLAIVTAYMPNGSLNDWLHPGADMNGDASSALTLLQRLNIAIDVASALDYLHHYSGTTIVHCDLKPSNVLLDNDMVAHLCDFGSAELLKETTSGDLAKEISRISRLKGSIGYVAPEYGLGGTVSTKGDVYSYGVLVLEMFSGRRPTDSHFKDGENLHRYVKMAYPAQIFDIVDPSLLLHEQDAKANVDKGIHKCLLSVIKVGLSCSNESATARMEMEDVIKTLHVARRILVEGTLAENRRGADM